MSEVLQLDLNQRDGRFSRFELISWWDQPRLDKARVLVIGAGALGNEILKNLALLGIGNVVVADLDRIENSNLSRSVLFRAEDCGKSKAEVAAKSAQAIYPGMRVQSFHGNIVYDLGLGIFGWADVILGGLDNREARVAINSAAARRGKIWIDGAIERLDGIARVFDPAVGPCYECTMGANDWKMLEARRSCALLRRDEMEQGKVPTTPTTASIIAAIQCQEAVKLLHGLEVMSGRGFVFEGLHHQSYMVDYSRKEDCPSHEMDEPVVPIDASIRKTSAGDFLEQIRGVLGANAVVDFNHDLLSGLHCAKCDETEPVFASLGKVSERQGKCPTCASSRTPQTFHSLSGKEAFLDRTLAELGVPLWDILSGRDGVNQCFYEFTGDRSDVLGPVHA
jgi:molybdopterin/thiamine biosynthesis adenylyltransferase